MQPGRDDDFNARLRKLENWQRDVARELREWERWLEVIRPFIEQLQADLTYRQKRHAERVSDWSRAAKVLAAIVAFTAIASFVLQLVHAAGGH